MDLIVSVCRALANPSRLALLQVVYTRPGITVQALAAAQKRPVDAVSRDLKLLRSFHLVQTVPHGRYVPCRPAREGRTSQRFLRALMKPVLESRVLNRTLVQVCDATGDTGRAHGGCRGGRVVLLLTVLH